MLCAYVVTTHGRATPLCWKTHTKSKLTDGARTAAEHDLIERLSRAISEEVSITLLPAAHRPRARRVARSETRRSAREQAASILNDDVATPEVLVARAEARTDLYSAGVVSAAGEKA